MPNPHLSILVVDDAKFSSAMIGRALSQAGYQDVRFASSATEALQLLEQRPASVLLADWLMPEIDGLELTARVRQLDETADHYTYIILLTGKEGENVLGEAFDRGVDDFISKAAMNEQLVPRVYAADRLCNTLQRLLHENRMLTQNIASLERRNLIDPLTGLGNPRYLRQKLTDSLRQVESRGGAVCYLLIGLQEASQLRSRYGDRFFNELLHGVARRLQQLVRPLDVLTRLDDNHFGLITLLEDLHECSPSSFKRLHEGLNLKAFKTSEGFITLKAGISLVGLDAKALPTTPEQLLQHAETLLADSYASGRVAAVRLPLP
ncbi:Response regulator PleD [Pseudomonas sp. THAF187a]|jgi:diguanylate cyclase (GGDEF)-like protein|uniref:Response regulator receiver modulated diguanylate cyclase n=1 Tax=Ectopseudomonas oleovorans TaxID=301 RepID=A0A653B742_ECTOL|nr:MULTISPECIES: response regulator [Pseudomonas]TNF13223.1 MAG: response regulator [Pseudomonadales bacterium]CAE6897978.1 Response regulator PleD [Pseudomonas oleovorans]QFT20902.1 Response regulator PleD [Pseudomonas sp. THAF187a]QFT41091.1 Response regulator PleD [Pseudomonas sp. THAF42]QTS87523.1 response regulator [Pseudomonas khazarica]|tara:strand:+ start:514 stop:1476 length:963 start_codon:yes stop_codon:yes gene_type:complete